jgi:hypothetical protein
MTTVCPYVSAWTKIWVKVLLAGLSKQTNDSHPTQFGRTFGASLGRPGQLRASACVVRSSPLVVAVLSLLYFLHSPRPPMRSNYAARCIAGHRRTATGSHWRSAAGSHRRSAAGHRRTTVDDRRGTSNWPRSPPAHIQPPSSPPPPIRPPSMPSPPPTAILVRRCHVPVALLAWEETWGSRWARWEETWGSR